MLNLYNEINDYNFQFITLVKLSLNLLVSIWINPSLILFVSLYKNLQKWISLNNWLDIYFLFNFYFYCSNNLNPLVFTDISLRADFWPEFINKFLGVWISNFGIDKFLELFNKLWVLYVIINFEEFFKSACCLEVIFELKQNL